MAGNDKGRKGPDWQRIRSLQHIGMGVVYIIIAALLFWGKTFGAIALSAGVAYTLGGLVVVYGVFRIWRGVMELKAGRE